MIGTNCVWNNKKKKILTWWSYHCRTSKVSCPAPVQFKMWEVFQLHLIYMCVYIYIYIYIYTNKDLYIYIYIYTEREREREGCVVSYWARKAKFKFWARMFIPHFAVIHLMKAWIKLFLTQLNFKTYYTLWPWRLAKLCKWRKEIELKISRGEAIYSTPYKPS